jgi:CheY-like chemotaxis protein
MSSDRDVSIILVVDDDPECRELLTDLLTNEGYSVVCAEDGRQALEYMDSSTPGLVLLDLKMPNMSGWEFLAQQKSDPRLASVPVVVISGSGLAPEVQARAVVHKPIDFDVLKRVVEQNRLKSASH